MVSTAHYTPYDRLFALLPAGRRRICADRAFMARPQPLFNVYSRRLRLRPAPCSVPTVCPAAAGKVHSRRIGDNRNRIHRGVHSKPAHGAKRMGLFRQAVQSLQTDMPRFRAALGSAFAAHSAAVRSYKIGAFRACADKTVI